MLTRIVMLPLKPADGTRSPGAGFSRVAKEITTDRGASRLEAQRRPCRRAQESFSLAALMQQFVGRDQVGLTIVTMAQVAMRDGVLTACRR